MIGFIGSRSIVIQGNRCAERAEWGDQLPTLAFFHVPLPGYHSVLESGVARREFEERIVQMNAGQTREGFGGGMSDRVPNG